MTNLQHSAAWQALSADQARLANTPMRALFQSNPERFQQMHAQACGILLDYSRQRLDAKALTNLLKLAETSELATAIKALFAGDNINHTEDRPALHTLLRAKNSSHPEFGAVQKSLMQMSQIVHAVASGQWLGATGKKIQHIINVGIGGSHTGPYMVTTALQKHAKHPFQLHFVSTVDAGPIERLLREVDLETAIIIVSSKSFTTIETLTNAKTLIQALTPQRDPKYMQQHVIAVTAKPEKAQAFGVPATNIIPIWDWVGGRYSVWSAIGLPIMFQLGETGFQQFLAGAAAMDEHFSHAEMQHNLPAILGLLSLWNINFQDAQAHAIIPYADCLRLLVTYLQQAEMESNGKCINRAGQDIAYRTAPVIFGDEGCNGQHTYHQMLHQSHSVVPVDMILIGDQSGHPEHDHILLGSALSQAQALMQGKTLAEATAELQAQGLDEAKIKSLAPHKVIPGNKPCNILYLQELTPFTLGSLLALYEHQIFVESVLWDINAFDQWGVELGKQLLPQIVEQLRSQQINEQDLLAPLLHAMHNKDTSHA